MEIRITLGCLALGSLATGGVSVLVLVLTGVLPVAFGFLATFLFMTSAAGYVVRAARCLQEVAEERRHREAWRELERKLVSVPRQR